MMDQKKHNSAANKNGLRDEYFVGRSLLGLTFNRLRNVQPIKELKRRTRQLLQSPPCAHRRAQLLRARIAPRA